MTDKITAKEILVAIRRKFSDQPVVREVVIRDEYQMAIDNRRKLEGPHAEYYAKVIEEKGWPVADSVPEDWSRSDVKFERRIDALILDGQRRTAVEIKVTRADFKRDTDDKRRAWRAHTHRFFYAVPKGLVTPDEVADGCGLWEYNPLTAQYSNGGLEQVKRAKINKQPKDLPYHLVGSMFYRVSNYEKKEWREANVR